MRTLWLSSTHCGLCPARHDAPVRVLLIDDDRALVAALTAELHGTGVDVVTTAAAPTAVTLLASHAPHLIVLGVRAADGHTLDLLRALRRASAAVLIVLVGQGDEAARIRGLELGADDYVRTPVSARELAARIRALLRHHAQPSPVPAATILRVGSLTLDVATYTAMRAAARLHLTVTEFQLLRHLMTHAGTVVTLATLLREVWGYEDVTISDVVRTAVYRLRQKLGDDPADPQLLHTIPGVGFLRAEPAPHPRVAPDGRRCCTTVGSGL
jgi:two-component system KDP operon response regulator KdpE